MFAIRLLLISGVAAVLQSLDVNHAMYTSCQLNRSMQRDDWLSGRDGGRKMLVMGSIPFAVLLFQEKRLKSLWCGWRSVVDENDKDAIISITTTTLNNNDKYLAGAVSALFHFYVKMLLGLIHEYVCLSRRDKHELLVFVSPRRTDTLVSKPR